MAPERSYWNPAFIVLCLFWAIVVVYFVYRAVVNDLVDKRKSRRMAGQCEECGYDLVATTEPRCPECGHPFDPQTTPHNWLS